MAKFDWIPYLEGKYLTYYQWFAVIGSTALLALSLLSFVLYLLLCRIKTRRDRLQGMQNIHQEGNRLHALKEWFLSLGFVFLSMIPLICAALDVVYLFEGAIGMAAILILMVYVRNGTKQYEHVSSFEHANTFVRKALHLGSSAKKQIIKMIVVAILANLFLYKTCLCFYNSEIGYYNQALGFGINTYFTRLFQLQQSCPPGAPCQVYATVPQDAAHAFFLNLHTHIDVQEVTVFYQELHTENVTEFKNVTANSYDYYGLEWKASRKVHSALIDRLKPNTKYLIKVFYQGKYWINPTYKTLPDDPSTPVRMINAGDSGYTDAAIKLSKIVATLNPDIFFIGGDIAYDDNMPACAYTWDYFLTMYGRITTTIGYLMPIVLTVGNHDVGLNELPGVNITVNNYGPAYFLYFPQHFDRTIDHKILRQVPPIERRRTILQFAFSNIHYLCLDSGYMHGFDGYQKAFMLDSFERNRHQVKFVNYHVPIYSVCESFDRNPERFLFALFHWVPNFDKYKVMTVFENHVHSFKRTKPLKGNSPNENGTIYLGDGAYGALISEMCHPDATIDIFDSYSKMNNFWVSDIYADRVQHKAYGPQSQILDQFVQYVDAYKIASTEETSEIKMEQTVIEQV